MDIKPNSVPLDLQAPGNGALLSGAAGAEAAEELGMGRIDNVDMQKMRKLGIDVAVAGIVITNRGFAFGTKKAIYRCIEQLEEKIAESQGEELHFIAGSLAKLGKTMSTLVGSAAEDAPKDPKPPRKSFAAGQNAQFHLHKHFHGATAEKPA